MRSLLYIIICLFPITGYAQLTNAEIEKMILSEIDSFRVGKHFHNDYKFNPSNEKYFLSLIKKYRDDPSEDVRGIIRIFEMQIGYSTNDTIVRQEVVEDFCLDCSNPESAISQYAANRLFESFKEKDFSDSARKKLVKAFSLNHDNKFILVCGLAQAKELIPLLKNVAADFDRTNKDWYYRNALYARLALLRMNAGERTDDLITAVELEPDLNTRVFRLLPYIAYTRNPDCIKLIAKYLQDPQYLPGMRENDAPYDCRNRIVEYLAKNLDDFPVGEKLNYTNEDVETALEYFHLKNNDVRVIPGNGNQKNPYGTDTMNIHLPVTMNHSNNEFNGMVKVGNKMLFISQFPIRNIFVLDTTEIYNHIKNPALKLNLDDRDGYWIPNMNEVTRKIKGYEGIESVVKVGDKLFFTVETDNSPKNKCYVIKAQLNSSKSKIVFDTEHIMELSKPADLNNAGFEAMAWLPESKKLIVFFEYNNSPIQNPKAIVFDTSFNKITDSYSFDKMLPMRLTDVYAINDTTLIGINYGYRGDKQFRASENETLPDQGGNPLKLKDKNFTRLVILKIRNRKIFADAFSDIEIKDDGAGNYETIIPFADGWLLLTDEYPRPETKMLYVKPVFKPASKY